MYIYHVISSMHKILYSVLFLFIVGVNCAQNNNALALKYYTSGMEKYNATNYEIAIGDFSKAIEASPEFVEAYFQRGCAKHYSDDYNGAISDFDKAIELRPDSEVFYKQRGSSKTMLKDYKGAIEDCDKAIEIKPDYDKAYALRGILKIELGEVEGCNDLAKAGEYGYVNAAIFIKKYCK